MQQISATCSTSASLAAVVVTVCTRPESGRLRSGGFPAGRSAARRLQASVDFAEVPARRQFLAIDILELLPRLQYQPEQRHQEEQQREDRKEKVERQHRRLVQHAIPPELLPDAPEQVFSIQSRVYGSSIRSRVVESADRRMNLASPPERRCVCATEQTGRTTTKRMI